MMQIAGYGDIVFDSHDETADDNDANNADMKKDVFQQCQFADFDQKLRYI